MSMKRTKQRSSGKDKDNEFDPWAKKPEPEKTYEEHMEGKADDAFKPWALATKFAKGDLLTHPKFGKGVVVDVEATRIEILFADGKKKLGHAQAS